MKRYVAINHYSDLPMKLDEFSFKKLLWREGL